MTNTFISEWIFLRHFTVYGQLDHVLLCLDFSNTFFYTQTIKMAVIFLEHLCLIKKKSIFKVIATSSKAIYKTEILSHITLRVTNN